MTSSMLISSMAISFLGSVPTPSATVRTAIAPLSGKWKSQTNRKIITNHQAQNQIHFLASPSNSNIFKRCQLFLIGPRFRVFSKSPDQPVVSGHNLMLLNLPHAVISSAHQPRMRDQRTDHRRSNHIGRKCKPRRSREQATTKTSATAPIADLRWNTLTRSHSASEKRLQGPIACPQNHHDGYDDRRAVCPRESWDRPARPDPIGHGTRSFDNPPDAGHDTVLAWPIPRCL